jgi:hypothetical protein
MSAHVEREARGNSQSEPFVLESVGTDARTWSPSGSVRETFARWRLQLLAWMQRHEYPEWRTLGLPADRVHVIDIRIEITSESERGTRAHAATGLDGALDSRAARQEGLAQPQCCISLYDSTPSRRG